MMKVYELINELDKFSHNAEVKILLSSDFIEREIVGVEQDAFETVFITPSHPVG